MPEHLEAHQVGVSAAADYATTSKRYYGVTIANTGSGLVATLASVAGQRIDGILRDDPAAAGDPATVVVSGPTYAMLGGAVTAGDEVTVDANGAFVTATDDDHIAGICWQSGTSGEAVEIHLSPASANRSETPADWVLDTPTLVQTGGPATVSIASTRYLANKQGNMATLNCYIDLSDGKGVTDIAIPLPAALTAATSLGEIALVGEQTVDTTVTNPIPYLDTAAEQIKFKGLSTFTDTKVGKLRVSGSIEIT